MSYANIQSTGERSLSPGRTRAPNSYGQAVPTQPFFASPSLQLYPLPVSEHVVQFQRLLWASLVLPLGALICSLIYLGALSFWVTPVAFSFTTVFNIVLIVLVRKERGRMARVGPSVIAAQGTLICASLLVIAWVACFGIVLGMSVSAAVVGVAGLVAGGYVEVLFDIAEAGVMAALVVQSLRERKADRNGEMQVGAYPQQQQYTGESQMQLRVPYPPEMWQQIQHPPQMEQQYTVQQQYPGQIQINQGQPIYPYGSAML